MERAAKENQKFQHKLSLEQQLADQKQRLQQEKEQQKQYEIQLLQNIKDKEQYDSAKKHEYIGKAQQ